MRYGVRWPGMVSGGSVSLITGAMPGQSVCRVQKVTFLLPNGIGISAAKGLFRLISYKNAGFPATCYA